LCDGVAETEVAVEAAGAGGRQRLSVLAITSATLRRTSTTKSSLPLNLMRPGREKMRGQANCEGRESGLPRIEQFYGQVLNVGCVARDQSEAVDDGRGGEQGIDDGTGTASGERTPQAGDRYIHA